MTAVLATIVLWLTLAALLTLMTTERRRTDDRPANPVRRAGDRVCDPTSRPARETAGLLRQAVSRRAVSTMHWITDAEGAIDYTRMRSLTGVVLALVGGVAAIYAIFLHRDINTALVSIVVTALVLPLTGGKISDVIMQKINASATAKVVAGEAPGRRSTDPDVHPPSNP